MIFKRLLSILAQVGLHPAGIVQLQWEKYGVIISGVLNYGHNFREFVASEGACVHPSFV